MARPESTVTNLLDPAVQSIEDALKTGVKIQEEITRWWSDAFDQAGMVQDWQKRSQAMISEVIPAAQRNAEVWMRLMEDGYRANVALFRRMLATNGSSTQPHARTQEAWEASMDMMREGTQAMVETQMKMLGMWTDMVRRTAGTAEQAGRTAMTGAVHATKTASRKASGKSRSASRSKK